MSLTDEYGICPLCGRGLLEDQQKHHLIPKTFKGTETVNIHPICHRKIHSTFSERELLNYYNTIERILENEEIQKFVKWIKNKDPSFYVKTKNANRKNNRRR